jgi:hypothetical protein
VESANLEALRELESKTQAMEATVNDARTMEPTLQAYAETRQKLAQAAGLLTVHPRDPFVMADLLTNARSALAGVAEQARCDWDVFGEAERSMTAAASQLEMARRLAQEASTDQSGDSPVTVQAYGGLEQLTAALAGVTPRLQAVHGDWAVLDAEADRIANEAARFAAILRGELQAAQAAVSAITAAAAAVRTAGLWNGPYGVSIRDCPGAELLTQARHCLQQGSYDNARQAAESAQRAAHLAVAQAQAEVQRQQHAEEERLEQERRRRQQQEWHRRHMTSPSSSGHSRSVFGRSSFSSGSGVRRSSFSSRSGVGRSGW